MVEQECNYLCLLDLDTARLDNSLLRGLQSPRVADPDLVLSTSNIQLTVRGYKLVAYGLPRNSV
jgi:hypothetical protein